MNKQFLSGLVCAGLIVSSVSIHANDEENKSSFWRRWFTKESWTSYVGGLVAKDVLEKAYSKCVPGFWQKQERQNDETPAAFEARKNRNASREKTLSRMATTAVGLGLGYFLLRAVCRDSGSFMKNARNFFLMLMHSTGVASMLKKEYADQCENGYKAWRSDEQQAKAEAAKEAGFEQPENAQQDNKASSESDKESSLWDNVKSFFDVSGSAQKENAQPAQKSAAGAQQGAGFAETAQATGQSWWNFFFPEAEQKAKSGESKA